MLEVVEVKAALFELVDGDLCLALGVNIPVEVELPRGDWLRQVSVLVAERDAQLDDFQLINTVLDAVVLALVFGPTLIFAF